MNEHDSTGHEKFRHELKYVCSGAQQQMLKNRIRGLMTLDGHTGESGAYMIRSLYFDDYYNSCYFENENGTDPREKFRIRIYNGDGSRIRLELKKKVRGKTQKLSCPLTGEQCETLMEGRMLEMQEEHALIRKLLISMKTQLMRPRVIVEYRREPYVYKAGNVRVTFDSAIMSTQATGDFLKPEIHGRPVMPLGRELMEVKYDEFLPDIIYRNLQLDNLQQTAFSKYYICRKYTG